MGAKHLPLFDFPADVGVPLTLFTGDLMRAILIGILTLACLTLMCTKREAASKAEVREAIEAHLKQRPNLMMANMDLEVQDVKISGDTADALVQFRSKQSPNLVVGVSYKLRRVDGRWKVESTSSTSGMGGNPHGGGTPAPAPATTPEGTPLQSSH
jgi:hypothetical protein